MYTSNLDIDFVKHSTRFKCTRCARCCSLDVLLDEEEIRKLGESVDLKWRTTKKLFNGSSLVCCFLNAKTCTIYDKRPKLCRAYPFTAISENEVRKLHAHIPSSAVRVLGKDGTSFLIMYDDECPGIGKDGAVDWQEIVDLTADR